MPFPALARRPRAWAARLPFPVDRSARDLARSDPIVLTTIMEHHVNMLPWRVYANEVRFIGIDDCGCVDEEDLERQLRDAPTGRPRLVAVAGAYNVSGYTPPVHQLARLAQRYGARILIDEAQLVPHRSVNMRGSGPEDAIDFLVFSGHKMYAPWSPWTVSSGPAFLNEKKPARPMS